MPTSGSDNRNRTSEEHLKTIAGLLVDFFEGDRALGGPCLASIDDSLKRIAESLELLTGIAGVSTRLQRMEDRMEFQTTQIQSLHDMVSQLGDRRGDPPTRPEDGS